MYRAYNVENLKKRASLLQKVREFFLSRNVLEVDASALSNYATIDPYIDPIEIASSPTLFLHTSPEYRMKKLLADGMGDIYQLSHVFRSKESSSKHREEFTMLEWYRCNLNLNELIEETLQLFSILLSPLPVVTYSYALAMESIGNTHHDKTSYMKALEQHHIEFDTSWSKQELMHLVWSEIVEKQFPKDHFIVVTDFPPSESALAKVKQQGSSESAMRFEIYLNGYELANGYDELLDLDEHIKRFRHFNELRKKQGKKDYPLNEEFLTAIEKGLPQCTGVAVGFDRIVMLACNASDIYEVTV